MLPASSVLLVSGPGGFYRVGTAAYFSGSMTDEARPVLIERSSVV